MHGLFHDLAKVYDNLNRNKLLIKLEKYRVGG